MVGESRFGGITRGGFFGLMLVGGLVVGLFFIPELLQIKQHSKSSAPVSSESVPAPTSNSVTTTTTTSVTTAYPGSPEIVTLESRNTGSSWNWWAEVKNWFGRLSAPHALKVPRVGDRSTQKTASLNSDARASLGLVSQRLDGPRLGQISWESIRSPESRDAIGQARRDSMELARGLPSSAATARFAIIDFANGLDFIVTKGEQQMSPRDAINYLAKLDQAVSRSLAEDKVDRVIVKRWSQISMGPVLGKTMVGQRHDLEVASFDPQLTLTMVQVAHRKMKHGDPTTGRVEVGISGFLIGDDIKNAVLEANDGGIFKKLALRRDPRGYWFFNRGALDGRQTWTVRVYDKFGERYEKTYRFFPTVQTFPVVKSQYQIPFRMAPGAVGTFRSEDYDPRLDALFSLGSQKDRQTDANALFVSF